MNEFKFDLGDEARDLLNGYRGIVVARAQYLTGCNTYGLQSSKLKDGQPAETVWIDENRLALTAKQKVTIPRPAENPGGPHSRSEFPPSR